jgi:hypothetical protein
LPTRNFGETRIKLVGGLARGNIPAFNLYTGHGSFGSRFNIYAGNSFATMKLSEFLADRFISLFITQDFKSLLFRTHNFQPQIEWINNLGWGWLDDQDNHQGFEIRSFEKGYFETGLLLNNLLNTPVFNYGFGVFYRYGPYSFDKFADNMAYKLTLQFNFAP